MNQPPKPRYLPFVIMFLFPLIIRLVKDEDKERWDRDAKYTRAVNLKRAAKRIQDRESIREGKLYEQIIRDAYTRLGSHSPRHSPGGPETMPATNTRRRRVERVKFEWMHPQPEIVYFKIRTRKAGLFGYSNALPYRVWVRDLINEETLQELSFACERVVDAVYEDPRKGAWLRVHRMEGVGGLPLKVTFNDVLEHYPIDKINQAPVVIGIGDHKTARVIALAHIPHILVAGSSGSGKSNMVNHILCSLVRFADPTQLQLTLIDLKRMEFNYYEDLPHLKQPVIFTSEAALAALTACIDEIQTRTTLFSKEKVKELSAWNTRFPDKAMPRWLVVIDEFAELMLASGPKVAKETENLVTRITNLGRAVGIHTLICTQRPAVAVVPNSIKINMPLILAGRTPTAAQSGVILGDGSAAALPAIPGRMIALSGSDRIQIQTPYISDDAVIDTVRLCVGKSKQLIRNVGTGIAINDTGLLGAVVARGGSLAVTAIYEIVKEYGITVNECKGWLAAVLEAKEFEINGASYVIVRKGNGNQVIPKPPTDPKVIALDMMKQIRANKEKTN